MAWSPDGTRLVAVTGGLVFGSGHVIEVTINKSHSTVYTNDAVVCNLLAILSMLTLA